MGNIFFLTRYHSSTIVGYMEVAIESFPTNEPNPFPHFSLLLPFGAYGPKFFFFFSCIEIGVWQQRPQVKNWEHRGCYLFVFFVKGGWRGGGGGQGSWMILNDNWRGQCLKRTPYSAILLCFLFFLLRFFLKCVLSWLSLIYYFKCKNKDHRWGRYRARVRSFPRGHAVLHG